MRSFRFLFAVILMFSTALGQDTEVTATRQTFFAEMEQFWSKLGSVEAPSTQKNAIVPAPEDGKILLAENARREFASPGQSRIVEIGNQLQERYGEDIQAQMRDPLYKELVSLSLSGAETERSAASADVYRKDAAYTEATRAWTKSSGLATIKAWRGVMVVLLDGPLTAKAPEQQVRYAAKVDFLADNSYFQTNLGRHVWSGGYDVTFASEEVGPKKNFGWSQELRTISRPGKAFSQMFLGQEGWYVKFQPIRSHDFRLALPTLSSALLNLPLAEAAGRDTLSSLSATSELHHPLANPEASGLTSPCYVQGYPLDKSSKRQRGGVLYRSARGGQIRLGWDFSPVN
jgi:hypothetical protein